MKQAYQYALLDMDRQLYLRPTNRRALGLISHGPLAIQRARHFHSEPTDCRAPTLCQLWEELSPKLTPLYHCEVCSPKAGLAVYVQG